MFGSRPGIGVRPESYSPPPPSMTSIEGIPAKPSAANPRETTTHLDSKEAGRHVISSGASRLTTLEESAVNETVVPKKPTLMELKPDEIRETTSVHDLYDAVAGLGIEPRTTKWSQKLVEPFAEPLFKPEQITRQFSEAISTIRGLALTLKGLGPTSKQAPEIVAAIEDIYMQVLDIAGYMQDHNIPLPVLADPESAKTAEASNLVNTPQPAEVEPKAVKAYQKPEQTSKAKIPGPVKEHLSTPEQPDSLPAQQRLQKMDAVADVDVPRSQGFSKLTSEQLRSLPIDKLLRLMKKDVKVGSVIPDQLSNTHWANRFKDSVPYKELFIPHLRARIALLHEKLNPGKYSNASSREIAAASELLAIIQELEKGYNDADPIPSKLKARAKQEIFDAKNRPYIPDNSYVN